MTGVIYQGMLNLKISFYWIILHTLCRLPQLPFYLSFLCCSRGIFQKRDLEVSQGVCEKLLQAANIMEVLKSCLIFSLIFVVIVLFIRFCPGNELNDVFCTILNVACDTISRNSGVCWLCGVSVCLFGYFCLFVVVLLLVLVFIYIFPA